MSKPTKEQINALIAKEITGWQPREHCDGYWTQRGDIQYCDKCGYQDDWCSANPDFKHKELVPNYAGNLETALEAAGQHFTIVELTRKKYYDPGDVTFRAHVYHTTFGAAHYSSQESMAHALCMTMLEARGVSVHDTPQPS
jgi:hypothetical protein